MELRDRQDSAYKGTSIARGISVGKPAAHEGIGNALRTTYVTQAHDIPNDMMALLAKLR